MTTHPPELLHCLSLISHFIDMTPDEVLSKKRTDYHVFVRQCVVKLLRKQRYGYQKIADILGYKTHASVLYLANNYSIDLKYKFEEGLLNELLKDCETVESLTMKIDILSEQLLALIQLRDGLKLKVA